MSGVRSTVVRSPAKAAVEASAHATSAAPVKRRSLMSVSFWVRSCAGTAGARNSGESAGRKGFRVSDHLELDARFAGSSGKTVLGRPAARREARAILDPLVGRDDAVMVLVGGEVAMPQNARLGILDEQAAAELEHRRDLRRGARVLGLERAAREPADIGDTERH